MSITTTDTETSEFVAVVRVSFEVRVHLDAAHEGEAEELAEKFGEEVARATHLVGGAGLDAYPENFDWDVEFVSELERDEDEDEDEDA
jgi:hypothetical protein